MAQGSKASPFVQPPAQVIPIAIRAHFVIREPIPAKKTSTRALLASEILRARVLTAKMVSVVIAAIVATRSYLVPHPILPPPFVLRQPPVKDSATMPCAWTVAVKHRWAWRTIPLVPRRSWPMIADGIYRTFVRATRFKANPSAPLHAPAI